MNRGDSVIVQGFPPEAGRSDEGVDTLLLLSNQFPARNFTIVGVFDALAEYGDRIAILASRDFVDDLRRWCSNFPFWTTSIGDFSNS